MGLYKFEDVFRILHSDSRNVHERLGRTIPDRSA